MLRTLRLPVAVAAACLLALPVHAQKFPVKSVKIIVTAAAGGGEDTEARAIAPYLEKHLGTSVVIEYQGTTGYRTRDFTPVFAWARSSQLLVVNAESWKTFEEFLKAAKGKTLSGGLSGRGSTPHLMGLIALDELGINANWVPYEGSAGSVAALAGKHLDFTICLATSAVSLIQAGKLRPLLLFSDKRDPYLADVPIPKDLGYDMTFIPALRGVEAPPNTPAAVVKVLEDAFRKAAAEQGFVEVAKKRKIVLQPVGSAEYAKAVSDV